uniref:Ovule protein n=1 Tax=Brugia timori TaxID=42155 RepID=A0A0R3R674_9BILA
LLFYSSRISIYYQPELFSSLSLSPLLPLPHSSPNPSFFSILIFPILFFDFSSVLLLLFTLSSFKRAAISTFAVTICMLHLSACFFLLICHSTLLNQHRYHCLFTCLFLYLPVT